MHEKFEKYTLKNNELLTKKKDNNYIDPNLIINKQIGSVIFLYTRYINYCLLHF